MFTLSSCTKHLDRDDAKNQIISKMNYPLVKTYQFPKSYTKDENTQGNGVTINLGGDDFEKIKTAMEGFKGLGLLKFEEEPHREESSSWLLGTTIRTWTTVKVSLTEDAKKFLNKEDNNSYVINLWETTVDDVSGIQELEQQKTAIVEYTIFNKNITPFGDYFSDKNETSKRTIYFSLYDDGWRIK